MDKLKLLLLDRNKKINYIRKKIKKYVLFSGGNGEKLDTINKNIFSSKDIEQKIKHIDTGLKKYSENFGKIVKYIGEIEANKNFISELKGENIEKVNFIANLNSRNKRNFNNSTFSDSEYIKSLNTYFFELVDEFKLLKLDDIEKYDSHVESNLKNLSEKINKLTEAVILYKTKNKNDMINTKSEKIININNSEIIININNVGVIVEDKNENERILIIGKLETIIPIDLKFIDDFIKKINLKKSINLEIDESKQKKLLESLIEDLEKNSLFQNGGEINFDEKISLLFKLEDQFQQCNLLLQEIVEKNKEIIISNEKTTTNMNIIFELLGKQIKKKYIYVNNEDIDLFLGKMKKEDKKHEVYEILENIFKFIRGKLNDKKCIDITKIQNEEIQKIFILFNAIMFGE
jgi:hypothetical protein